MERLACLQRFLTMVIQLNEDQCGPVRHCSSISEPLPIANDVTQGRVLAPTLFSIFFSMMLQQATEVPDGKDNVYMLCYWAGSSVFNARRPQVHTKTCEQPFWDLLLADGSAIVGHTEAGVQRIMYCFAEAAQLFELEVSLKETEVLRQPSPQGAHQPPRITITQWELKRAHHFNYLGWTFSSDAKLGTKVEFDWQSKQCIWATLQESME